MYLCLIFLHRTEFFQDYKKNWKNKIKDDKRQTKKSLTKDGKEKLLINENGKKNICSQFSNRLIVFRKNDGEYNLTISIVNTIDEYNLTIFHSSVFFKNFWN